MAQWYAHLVFRGDRLLGEGLEDFANVEGVVANGGGEAYTAVVVSGYALYGKLRGYYSLGVSQIRVDPDSGAARYASEESALRKEPVDTLTPRQLAAVRDWLIEFNPEAWENSTEPFKLALEEPVAAGSDSAAKGDPEPGDSEGGQA